MGITKLPERCFRGSHSLLSTTGIPQLLPFVPFVENSLGGLRDQTSSDYSWLE